MERKEKLLNKVLWDYIDLQEYGGLSRTAAYQLLNRADMPVVKIGGRKYMNAEKFKSWIDEHTQTANV